MIGLRYFAMPHLTLTRSRVARAMVLGAVIQCACLSTCCARAKPRAAPRPPDVLVLVLSSGQAAEQVGINYASAVLAGQARKDIKALSRETGWLIENVSVATRSSGAPGGRRTTSAMFRTPAIVNRTEGLLPLEPFVSALKRFKSIQVNYIFAAGFSFRGLKDFENNYVKIVLSSSANSCVYRIRVKNSNFERLGLPLRQPVKRVEREAGMSSGARVALILGLAVICSVAAYLAVLCVSRRRASRR